MQVGGASRIHVLVAACRKLRVALVALMVALALASCGSGASEPRAAATQGNLLKPAELSRHPDGSVQRAFLQFWSDLQFRSWADAASYYDRRLQSFVGTAMIVSAKKQNASSFPLLKPAIVRVATDRGQTTVYYSLRLPEGTKELDSTTWRREGGNWQMIYDSRLDTELGQLARNRTEIEGNGSLPTNPNKPLSRAAGRAGSAAEQLQARFLQEELKVSRP